MIEHLVLFKLKAGVSEEDKRRFVELLQSLSSAPGAGELSAGLNDSPEGLSKGYEVGLRVLFADDAARNAYLPSPEHISIVEQLQPYMEDVLVLDYPV